MHWCDRRTAIANFGRALRRDDWTLFGWKDDASDAMVDYYSPESWAGIATKDAPDGGSPFVVVVDVRRSELVHRAGVDGWPEFQANPQRRKWHVERDGRILNSGVGLAKCLRSDAESDDLVRRVNRSVSGRSVDGGSQVLVDDVTVRENHDRHGIEVIFPGKPDENTRTRLKAAGFRWSRGQGLWWAQHSHERMSFARSLAPETRAAIEALVGA